MPNQLDFSMQQLAQIALGGPRFTNVNVSILHSLFDIIFKKLNCADEKVSIGGYESKCLEELLKESKISPLPFNDEKVELINEKLERLTALEERVTEFEDKLQRHFREIEECSKASADKSTYWPNFDKYDESCEDLCSKCEPDNEIACSLIKNSDFLRKLLRRVSKPVIDHVLTLETKINELHTEFMEFLKRAEEEYTKIKLVEQCIIEIEKLREIIVKNHQLFISTMEEIQDLLDAKLDKVHIPAMKKWIKSRFNAIDSELKRQQEIRDCPKAAGIIMTNIKCLSCGGEKICPDVGVQPTGILPDASPGTFIAASKPHSKKSQHYCGCSSDEVMTHEAKLMDRIKFIDYKLSNENEECSVTFQKRNHKKSLGFGGTRRLSEVLGSDGNVYRAEHLLTKQMMQNDHH